MCFVARGVAEKKKVRSEQRFQAPAFFQASTVLSARRSRWGSTTKTPRHEGGIFLGVLGDLVVDDPCLLRQHFAVFADCRAHANLLHSPRMNAAQNSTRPENPVPTEAAFS